MIILGLTGSIATGKSTATAMLRHMGVHVHDSDRAIHEIYASNKSLQNNIYQHFEGAYSHQTGTINKSVLAQIIFNDPAKKALLESWIHPLVQESQQRFIKRASALNQKIVVLDIPLLYETGAESRCDYVVVTTAPPQVQRRRALSRPGMTTEKFARILNSQMRDSEKRARADFIIHTGLSRRFIYEQIQDVLRRISAA